MVKSIIKPTIVLMLIAGIIAALLSFTYNVTGVGKLGKGFTDEQLEKYGAIVLPDSAGLVQKEYVMEDKNFLGVYADKDGNGLALHVGAKGYGGQIGILVGFDNDGVIQGITVVKCPETPGLGTKIQKPEYLENYVGLSKTAQEVDTITNATVSSAALRDGVDFAFSIFETVKGGIE